MFIDTIVLVLCCFALFKGLRKGFVVALFSFAGFFIGLLAALKLSAVAAAYLGKNVEVSERWLPVLAFVLVFVLVVFLVRLGAKAVEGVLRVAMLGWANKIGGVLLFLFLYLFVFSIILFYADELKLIAKDTKEASVTFGYLQPLGPKLIKGAAAVLPFFKNMFTELESFFEAVSAKGARG